MRHTVELCLLCLVGFFLFIPAGSPFPDPHGWTGPWPDPHGWTGPFPDPHGWVDIFLGVAATA